MHAYQKLDSSEEALIKKREMSYRLIIIIFIFTMLHKAKLTIDFLSKILKKTQYPPRLPIEL